MKHVLLLFLAASIWSGFGQGLVNFNNTPSTLISDIVNGATQPISGPVQSYFFALLTSPVGADTFSFAGIYATNTLTPGMINGGSGAAAAGWAAGTQRDFVVFGWRVEGGLTYNPSWLNPNLSLGANHPAAVGLSSIGTGVAGGGALPALNLFGGQTGIQNGFSFQPILVPEPSTTSLLGLAAAALLIRYRRKPKNPW